jgi:hypothetical protein
MRPGAAVHEGSVVESPSGLMGTGCDERRTSLPDFKYEAASFWLVKKGPGKTLLCLVEPVTVALRRAPCGFHSCPTAPLRRTVRFKQAVCHLWGWAGRIA